MYRLKKKNIVNIHPPVKNKTYRYLILLNDGIVAIKPNKFNTYKLFDSQRDETKFLTW